VGIVTIPLLIRALGLDRFGVLTLAWLLIGYLGLFDLGLGRAVTKLVAERLGTEDHESIPALVWTALGVIGGLGVIATAGLLVATPELVHQWLKIPVPIQDDAGGAFILIALAIPAVTVTTGLRAILEATQRFDLAGPLRLGLGTYTFVAPLVAVHIVNTLTFTILSLVLGRIIVLLLHLYFALRVLPDLKRVQMARAVLKPLLSFGGWVTVSNVIGPLLAYLDRFLIGGVLSVTSVAYYATPFDMVTRLLVAPYALAGVAYPAFAAELRSDKPRVIRVFNAALAWTIVLLFPVLLILMAFSKEILQAWLGADFASRSGFVLEVLSLGVMANALAQVPFALVQASGRPDLTAKLHLIELPLYVAALWVMIGKFGVVGAALAWTARATIDSGLLFTISFFIPSGSRAASLRMALVGVATMALLSPPLLPLPLIARLLYSGAAVGFGRVLAWRNLLDGTQKSLVVTTSRRLLAWAL